MASDIRQFDISVSDMGGIVAAVAMARAILKRQKENRSAEENAEADANPGSRAYRGSIESAYEKLTKEFKPEVKLEFEVVAEGTVRNFIKLAREGKLGEP
jgi:hypothetical protein